MVFMSNDIKDKLVNYILEVCDVENIESITDESLLKDDLLLDSMQMVNMIADLEDEYGLNIEDKEIISVKTVGDVVNIIKSKIK